jgi:hypothetical protein
MKNKIVLEFIKKELVELNILIDTLQQKEELEQLLIDITTSKAKTLLQELALLKGMHQKEQYNNAVLMKETTSGNEVNVSTHGVIPINTPIENTGNKINAEIKETSDNGIETHIELKTDTDSIVQMTEIIEEKINVEHKQTSETSTPEKDESNEPAVEKTNTKAIPYIIERSEQKQVVIEKQVEEARITSNASSTIRSENYEPAVVNLKAEEIPHIIESPEQNQAVIEEQVEEAIITSKASATIRDENNEPAVVNLKAEEIPHIIENSKQNQSIIEEQVEEAIINDCENDDKAGIEEKKILGEQFTKEKSLNEQLASLKKHSPAIKGKTISSLKQAIGINDKYLFTRELFGNNPSNFGTAIETLDQASNLMEAVEHLEQNYKWQKNETSLKFMNLVKRRFEN